MVLVESRVYLLKEYVRPSSFAQVPQSPSSLVPAKPKKIRFCYLIISTIGRQHRPLPTPTYKNPFLTFKVTISLPFLLRHLVIDNPRQDD